MLQWITPRSTSWSFKIHASGIYSEVPDAPAVPPLIPSRFLPVVRNNMKLYIYACSVRTKPTTLSSNHSYWNICFSRWHITSNGWFFALVWVLASPKTIVPEAVFRFIASFSPLDSISGTPTQTPHNIPHFSPPPSDWHNPISLRCIFWRGGVGYEKRGKNVLRYYRAPLPQYKKKKNSLPLIASDII